MNKKSKRALGEARQAVYETQSKLSGLKALGAQKAVEAKAREKKKAIEVKKLRDKAEQDSFGKIHQASINMDRKS